MSGSTWLDRLSIFTAVAGVWAVATPASADEIAVATAKRGGHATINEVLINGRDGGRDTPATVRPGSPITVQMVFQSDSSGWCPKCSNQIVVGYARQKAGVLERLPGGKCVYSGSGRHSGEKLTFRMAAPTAPGNYRMIVSAPQAYNCTKALRWRATPHAVAMLDVKNR